MASLGAGRIVSRIFKETNPSSINENFCSTSRCVDSVEKVHMRNNSLHSIQQKMSWQRKETEAKSVEKPKEDGETEDVEPLPSLDIGRTYKSICDYCLQGSCVEASRCSEGSRKEQSSLLYLSFFMTVIETVEPFDKKGDFVVFVIERTDHGLSKVEDVTGSIGESYFERECSSIKETSIYRNGHRDCNNYSVKENCHDNECVGV